MESRLQNMVGARREEAINDPFKEGDLFGREGTRTRAREREKPGHSQSLAKCVWGSISSDQAGRERV